jgi:putative transposase
LVRSGACRVLRAQDRGRARTHDEATQAHAGAGHRQAARAQRLLGEGRALAEVAKTLQIGEQIYQRWRNQYGGMKTMPSASRELECENALLKWIVADKELENVALKEIAKTNW